MSARLSVASVDVKGLLSKAEKGDRTAALELANTYKCRSVRELIEVVSPLDPPSVAIFDCLCDAIHLKERRDAKRPPALQIK